MKKHSKYIFAFSAMTLAMSQAVFAAEQTDEEKANEDEQRVTITGSRLQKAEFDQAAPVQVLNVNDAIKSGINNVADLLQRTSMAGGQQLDATYNSNSGNSNASEAPPSGGVGSSNIGLRGLGPERTLILVNGRRLGASGVRGAPSQPDLNLLPLNMVERIEIITEGASSIYGADAVAGVVNVIMKRGYEGAEVSANVTKTKDGGGDIRQFSFVTGHQSEKSNFVVSMSYYDRKSIKVGQRAGDCIVMRSRDEDGNVYDPCRNRFFNNVVLNFSDNPNDIFAFYTPGSTDIGIPDFSSGFGLPVPPYDDVSIEGSMRSRFVYNPDYHDQWDRYNSDLVQPVKRFTLATNGTYALDLFGGDEELFYEAYYFHRHLTNQAASEQQIPTVAGMIPHEDANGNLVRNPDGSLDLVDNPLNPFTTDAMPIVTIDDLSQKRDVELDHVRFVFGLRGDFPSETLREKNWNYEMYASYDRGMGHQSQPVLHEEHLFLSQETLRLDVNGNPVCGISRQTGDFGGILSLMDCVPVNWFAPSIFNVGQRNGGTFASQAERDYLVATRTNRTVVEQAMFNAYATGDLFDFSSGGSAVAAMGIEYRRDDIWSAVDYLGATGGNAAENPLTEGPTFGSRDVSSAYAEVSLPILVDQDGADLLELEAAVRYTDESNFGNELTQRARLTYKPVDWVMLSGSYGTSFRAPNLREQFLADQFQGVSGGSDPCAVPGDASAGGVYNPSLDNRPQIVIDNCIASGADYTSLGLNGILNIPVTVGGNAADLLPETSENYTYSLKLTPDWEGDFKLNFAITFFDIEIEDTIRSINGATIMSRCYNDAPNLASPFCARITRDGTGKLPSLNFVSAIDASFVNVGLETSSGFDINVDYSTDFDDLLGLPVNLTWTNQYTQMTEREVIIFQGEAADDLLEDFGNPKHRLVSNLELKTGDWSLLLTGRYQSETHANDTISKTIRCDDFVASAELIKPDGTRPNVQPICEADAAFYLDASLSWTQEDFRLSFGINNVFDKQPPLIAMGAGSNRANRVTSSGYDQFGQTYFLNATYNF
ncbi:TonB-dependent receptor domain-containing protein [Aliikangiella sp. IMCC44359]|uniref:TonB-dependent receptor domain-containing protein n=1 Tax=Aliikangiella sp. IMCC44359 TaxID=3459125 RepID=UPI00403AF43B